MGAVAALAGLAPLLGVLPWRLPAVALLLAAALGVSALTAYGCGRKRLAVACLVLCVAAVGAWRGADFARSSGARGFAPYFGERVRVRGALASAPARAGATGFRLQARSLDAGAGWQAVDGTLDVRGASADGVELGEEIVVLGRLERYRATRAAAAATKAPDAAITADTVVPQSLGALDLAPAAARARSRLAAAVRRLLPEPEATLLLGEMAGVRGSLPPGVQRDLTASGLAHVLAISGLKVAIVTSLVVAVLRPVLGRRGALAGIALVAAYVLVGGASASAIRSAVMGSAGLVAGAVRRDTDTLRSLLLAGTGMLTLEPGLAGDVSFQFSFLGVLGIQTLGPGLARQVGFLPRMVREAFATTAAAQLATLPLTAHYFQVLPLAGPVANALVLPTLPAVIVSGLAMVSASAAASLAAWHGAPAAIAVALGVPFASVALLGCLFALAVAHLVALVPGAAIPTPTFPAPAVAAYYVALLGVVAGGRAPLPASRRARAGTAAVGLAAATAVFALSGRPDGHAHVHFLAGVSGPAVLVVAPDGATLLVDAGTSAGALRPALDAALPPAGQLPGLPRRLDTVFLTGSSAAESGGLPGLGAYSVSTLLLPATLEAQAAAAAAAEMSARGTRVVPVTAGQRWSWHDLVITADDVGVRDRLGVVVGEGGTAVLVADSSSAAAAPLLPPGTYAAVAVGTGAGDPVDDGVATAWLVVQPVAGHAPTRLLAQRYGARLYRTDRDGPLELVCDPVRCRGT